MVREREREGKEEGERGEGGGVEGRRWRGERDTTCCHPLYPAVTCCHQLPLVVTRFTCRHPLLPVGTAVTRRQTSFKCTPWQ